jgi:hypothetical protein
MSNRTEYKGETFKLPHYRTNKKCAFKIFNDGHCMYVRFNDGQPKIGTCTIDDVFEDTKECAHSDFMEEHRKVRDYINEMDLFFR